MNVARAFRNICDAVKRAALHHSADWEFTCGDCERRLRCGLPPTEDCLMKLMEHERDPTGYERRMKARAKILNSGFRA